MSKGASKPPPTASASVVRRPPFVLFFPASSSSFIELLLVRQEDAKVAEQLKMAHDESVDVHPHVHRPVHAVFEGDSLPEHKNETQEEITHRHRQVAGLKANLHREDGSEETKDRIRDELRELGEDAAADEE
jgi:hypothetical protein